MARLFDCFHGLYTFGLALDASLDARRESRSIGDIQQHVLDLLDAARARARKSGIGAQQIEQATFAMVAWIDEITGRMAGDRTGVAQLQMQLFNSNNAPSEFFHHLSALGPNDAAVREVYWQVLAAGFKGQYYFETDDQGELAKLKALHGQQLAARLPPLADGVPTDRMPLPVDAASTPPTARERAQRKRAKARARWGLAALALLVVLAPLLYRAWSLTGDASRPPRDTRPALVRNIELGLQRYNCADLGATLGEDGRARITGFVSQPEDVARVEQDVRAMPGVSDPQFDLQLRIWPHCEVFALLKPYRARNRDKEHGLRLAATATRDGRLREGDTVSIELTNADREGYLWVDYYTADGAVLHLSLGRARSKVRAGEIVEVGRDIPSSWLVSPPFGTVLVTVLATPVPLSENVERPQFELASAYLQWLRGLLGSKELADRVNAEFEFLETVPR
ncbi:MAG: DotU family type IV/VI secretion system protein [Gammaproteobacteria bacterium]|nr:DotU family type IV/VI secretion system protein [Gammaproteobacteria bacterium]MBU1443683.1 DotU family type IV/VI secretion system protein [Gammaproteobacteria bacterium]MBU2286297.1 DotU family type IV/VI secretion system protein [Gammaproteobacteria bacterium]MBU2408474.1 DotU family type IV/VI secretion system protein [Gammaproteobacteria bacterium]